MPEMSSLNRMTGVNPRGLGELPRQNVIPQSLNEAKVQRHDLMPQATTVFAGGMSVLPHLKAAMGVGVNALRFQGAIHNDYSVEIRGNVPINPYTVSQTLQSMLIRDMKKGDTDKSNLKFYMGAMASNGYPEQDQTALADSFVFIPRPVDMVVKSATTADGLFTMMSSTGKRFMYPGANILIGALRTGAGYRKNKDFQVNRELFNDYVRDLEYLVMERTGNKDRASVHQDLLSDREYNSLECLFYGKKGLADGVLIGHDKVITRKNLEAFYASKKWNPLKHKAEIAQFNKDYLNIYQVAKDFSTPLKEFSKRTLPSKDANLSVYQSLSQMLKSEDHGLGIRDGEGHGQDHGEEEGIGGIPGLSLDLDQAMETDEGIFVKVNMPKAAPKEMTFYVAGPKGLTRTTQLPLNAKALPIHKYLQMEVENASPTPRSVLDDDVIYFNDAFMDGTAEQIADALLALDEKKQKAEESSHIKILENSPGGSVWSGQELRSTIQSLKTPVDVIVTGMGASCGSWLLCSASGKRYATPNARVMIHEAASQQGMDNGKSFNEAADGLHQATVNYVQIVADATGRPFQDVWTDFKLDVWFNPLESLFYGKKGLIDGILVGPDKVVTRSDVEKYLIGKLGSRAKMTKFVEAAVLRKREPSMAWKPQDHDETDAFKNPLKVIRELSKSAKSLSETKGFENSMAQPAKEGESRKVNLYNVVPTLLDLLMDDEDDRRKSDQTKPKKPVRPSPQPVDI